MVKKRISMKGMGADTFFETPVNQQDSKQVNQYTDKPVSKLTGSTNKELTKATFYLTQQHIMKLERIRLERKQAGRKVDKSALVREAIDLFEE
jgi:hypothetical protein